MTDQGKVSTRGGSHLATADRRTLDAIFHHPVPHNLSWMDALDLLTHLGSAEEKADGKYSLNINGKHLIFHKPHGKHLDAREVTGLRHYLSSAGVSPESPQGAPALVEPDCVDVVALIDHHEAKLYRIHLSSNQTAETVRPYDPHHFLHHLHHGDELREHGQRAPEDLTFYDRIAEALREADRIVLLSHGTGMSDASRLLAERLQKHHRDIYARIVHQAEVNTSAMTEGEILAYARQALTTDSQKRQ
ncbi:MAG: hypothetical protein WA177_17075 [Xanthobacteraceae bacterium]|jgi:hypothetical protein